MGAAVAVVSQATTRKNKNCGTFRSYLTDFLISKRSNVLLVPGFQRAIVNITWSWTVPALQRRFKTIVPISPHSRRSTCFPSRRYYFERLSICHFYFRFLDARISCYPVMLHVAEEMESFRNSIEQN